ncbi:S53 family peptidase [Actinocrinis puniceicyclus]|uniref:S53 family peptidase n=1 Tax=Actinocrinis puniceicyclus TaxID=977794 RepID=A0A8J8BEA8_9ACTN|nr:S53 family peptidase [Actinocrinis puniceicyclus]MBS2967102.1 S53 family peptidase [Actinocrinis puniceicyclus]
MGRPTRPRILTLALTAAMTVTSASAAYAHTPATPTHSTTPTHRTTTQATSTNALNVSGTVPVLSLLALLGRQIGGARHTSFPPPTDAPNRDRRVCTAVAQSRASCHAIVLTDAGAGTDPAGYGPADLRSAYSLPSTTSGYGQTVALVDAYNDPTAESDLAVYRSTYGLPPCTTGNGCFRKVDQYGGTRYPALDTGWAQEISLDLDMVSAICPNCHILLVEAADNTFANLGAAQNEAAALHANAISDSWGGRDSSDNTYGRYFNHPGIAQTASSGDSGYGVIYPASSRYVTAVGGTSLRRTATGWTQTAWSGAGSGCSAYNTALPGQAGAATGCPRRAVADVSAVADPYTGVAVYDSTPSGGLSGWLVFGGTSVSAPIIASVYALAGNAASINNSYPYAHTAYLTDITVGSNGFCPVYQLCHARPGWDGPTGLGTPRGVGAF